MKIPLLLLALTLSLFAQNAALPPDPHMQFLDSSGRPLAGGKIYTCAATTTCPGTPLATYTDSTGTVQNPNPVILDASGYASIWIGNSAYKFVAQNSLGVQQWTRDNVSNAGAGLTGLNGASLVSYLASGSGAVSRSVAAKLAEVLSVKDFGAKGDGATDDTAAFQAAYAAAVVNGNTIYMPCGTYRLSSSAGTAALWIQVPNVSLTGESEACTILQYSGSGSALRIQMSPFVSTPAGRYENFTLKGTAAGQIGIQTGSLVSGNFRNIIVDGFTGASGIGIDLQDRQDLFSGSGGSWTERNTFDNVSGGGISANNTYDWVMETVGSPVNTSFGYNRFTNIQANVHSGQTGFLVKSGSFFYNSSMTLTCNLDESTGWTVAPVCISSLGNSDQNYVQISGEYAGTHSAVSVQGTRFVAYGYVNVTGAAMNFTGTPGVAPQLRVTSTFDGTTADTGQYSLYGGGTFMATPSVGFGDHGGYANLGVLTGANINSPFVSMFENSGNKFVVGSVPFNTALSGMRERWSVDSGGNTFQTGRLYVNHSALANVNGSYTMDLNGSLLIRGTCNTYGLAASGTLNVGGCTTTGRTGYYGAFFSATTGINETLGFGDANWSGGFGAVIGTNIAHPILWGLAADPVLVGFYSKTFQTGLASGDLKAWVTNGGAMVANGYQTTGGQSGGTAVVNVRNATNTGACTISFSSGLFTSSTCP